MNYELMTRIEDGAAAFINMTYNASLTEDEIRENVQLALSRHKEHNLADEEISTIVRRLQQRFDVKMDLGVMLCGESEDWRPWLNDARGEINWFFWDRYKRYLTHKGFSPNVVQGMNEITDRIIDHLENPLKEGPWKRKGMVVGHVQSGKTANYTGLICKAADSGYKVIIVLAGLLNSLRNQTQERIDAGFIGEHTVKRVPIGVGLINHGRRPAFFTTSEADFSQQIARQTGVGIGDLVQPAVLVVKKNSSTLRNLLNWLNHNNPHNLRSFPMLLIDDEADHASINTSPDEATAINSGIRSLLNAFGRSAYVGYTATPFANIFIDPDNTDDMIGDNLFPRDFIYCLDAPDNYVGPDKIFGEDCALDVVRDITDNIVSIPERHKKDFNPTELPESMLVAIRSFVLVRAIRLLRNHTHAHNSMMVNVSRFTAVQTRIKILIGSYLEDLRNAILGNCGLTENDALKNVEIFKLKKLWDEDFQKYCMNQQWVDVQAKLYDSIMPIETIEVNSSQTSTPLDYSEDNYPKGRNVIAVGGLGLSRGLTLEGLTVSYFLRNSIMYDTLMQMGRWFGYREDYAELCRVFMGPTIQTWYAHIADVMDELRRELSRMRMANMKPSDFGLCVRSHPTALIVTARNKMRTGRTVTRSISLTGRLVESSVVSSEPTHIDSNFAAMRRLVHSMNELSSPLVIESGANGYHWKNVPVDIINDFVASFINHPASPQTDSIPLKNYIDIIKKNNNIATWDVALFSPRESRDVNIEGLPVALQERSASACEKGIAINREKRRVGYTIQEAVGISREELDEIKREYLANDKKNIPGSEYRRIRKQPLLMLHIISCRNGEPINKPFVAYGISFPGEPGSGRPEQLVEYIVNTVWWRNEYMEFIEDEDIDND